MPDLEPAGLLIHVPDFQAAELRGAQPGIKQGKNERSIAFGCWPAHGELFPDAYMRFVTKLTGFEWW